MVNLLKEFFFGQRFAKLDGRNIELGKVYGNPMVNAFTPLQEEETKKLRIFDFDDTLVKTKSHIYITNKDGKKSKLTPGEYAIYEPKDGDNYDFSDFEQVKQPQEIKGVTKLLKTVVTAEGERKVVILTARSAYKPVKDYLQDIGLEGIYVVALASNNPQDKADWIEDKIKAGYNDVFFIDDSHKNISAVNKLKEKYPNIKMKVSHVKHDVPAPPKQSDMKSQKDKEATKKVEPKKNDMSLKALLPKRDLEKTIKNPETGNKIKIKTALGYDKTKPAYKAAQFALKNK
jgi:predicted DNA-binding antitoxin AbrB/MazE fold protein